MDVRYVRLRNLKIEKPIKVSENCLADVGKDGSIIGFELMSPDSVLDSEYTADLALNYSTETSNFSLEHGSKLIPLSK